MHILLSYPTETDIGEGQHFRRVLERADHRVTVVNAARARACEKEYGRQPGVQGFPAFVSVEELLEAYGEVDLFLYVEPLGLIPRGLERAQFPTACVISDVHRQLRPRLRLAEFFDHVFLYQRNYVALFEKHVPAKVHWFPWSCDVEFFRREPRERDLDIAFIGKLFSPGHERARVVHRLASRWRMNEQRYYLQREIPDVYARAKIVVNLPLARELNQRVFEALAAGALLVTQRASNGQEVLFAEGRHFVGFDGEAELLQQVERYLGDDAERAAIAAAGHAEMLAHHSLEARLRRLLAAVEADPAPRAALRRMSRAAVDRLYGWLYSDWAAVDASLALVEEARRSGRQWRPLLVSTASAFGRRLWRALG